MVEDDDFLPDDLVPLAVNAANEGIPVRAIARILAAPADEVYNSLDEAKRAGKIATLPAADWPPTARRDDRQPVVAKTPDDARDSMHFAMRHRFNLTNLEAAMLLALVSSERCKREKLHAIIKQRRYMRGSRPSRMEDPSAKMVDVMICKLRSKLRQVNDKYDVSTVWGSGYYIEADIRSSIIAHLQEMDHGKKESDTSAPDSEGA